MTINPPDGNVLDRVGRMRRSGRSVGLAAQACLVLAYTER